MTAMIEAIQMNDTIERTIVGWCNNDDCGEPIYRDDIHFIDGDEMYCDNCHETPEPEEI